VNGRDLLTAPLEGGRPLAGAHHGRAADNHESEPGIHGAHAGRAQTFLIVKVAVKEAAFHGIDLQVRKGIDLFVVHVAFGEWTLSLVVGFVRAEIVPVAPKGFYEVPFDADQAPSLQIAKDGFVTAHFLRLIQQNKHFGSFVIGNDRIGTPRTIGDAKGHCIRRGREPAECVPGLCSNRK